MQSKSGSKIDICLKDGGLCPDNAMNRPHSFCPNILTPKLSPEIKAIRIDKSTIKN